MTEPEAPIEEGLTEVLKTLRLRSNRRDPLGVYVLDGVLPRPAESMLEWAAWMETHDCRVARTEIPPSIEVSTVFLGFDHNWFGKEAILFETMVFLTGEGGRFPDSGYQRRYPTWAKAEAGHAEIVAELQSSLLPAASTPEGVNPPATR